MTELQTIINVINAGTTQEKQDFKNLIVNGLNAQDLADIMTTSTREQKEALAALIVQADDFLKTTQQSDAEAQRNAGIATATTWWDTNIVPQLTWNNTQPLEDQRTNIINDYNLVKNLLTTETDPFRVYVVKQKLSQAETQFKSIKQALIGG